MSRFKERLLTNWHPMRMLRLAIGLVAGISAIQSSDVLLGALGVFFLYQGITDTGCCSAMGCNYTPPRRQKHGTDSIEFEEVKNK